MGNLKGPARGIYYLIQQDTSHRIILRDHSESGLNGSMLKRVDGSRLSI